jgi:hypothetical protein
MKAFLAPFILVPFFAIAQKQMIWVPIMDQQAMAWINEHNQEDPFNDPGFTAPASQYNQYHEILNGLDAAYKKGFRTVDINFYTSTTTQPHPPGETAADLAYNTAMTYAGTLWVNAIEEYNRTHIYPSTDYMNIRIRVEAHNSVLNQILYRTNPTKYAALPGIPGARLTDSLGITSKTDERLPDLGNAFVRQCIIDYTNLVLNSVYPLLTYAKIKAVSLVVDGNGETCTLPTYGPPKGSGKWDYASFSNFLYPYGGSFASKLNFFSARQAALKTTLTNFSNAVTNFTWNGVKQGLLPAVFMQSYAMDARLRGAFDLAAFLKGTGVQVIHYTQVPSFWSYSAEQSYYTGSVARFLGKPFDTEFTWPSNNGPSNNNPDCTDSFYGYSDVCKTSNNSINADVAYFQGEAGIKAGVSGIVYGNYLTKDMRNPSTGYTASDAAKWENVIGLNSPNWNTNFLTRAGTASYPPGLLTYNELPAANKAIYISTIGRAYCEEYGQCGLNDYRSWFDDFGFNPVSEKIDILTDQMLKDTPAQTLKTKYTFIFIPYEVQKYIDPTVLAKLDAIYSLNSNVMRVQSGKHSPYFNQYPVWRPSVNFSYTSF